MAQRSRVRHVDVAVLGGGPAGSFAGLLLARRGVTVALIDPDQTRPRLEGLGPRAVDVLAQHGLDLNLDAPPTAAPRWAHWNGDGAARNVEHLVERAGFDRTLRFAASAAGVTCMVDRVRRVRKRRAGVRIDLVRGGGFGARLVIDARGRRAPRDGSRWRGPATLSASLWTPDPAASAATRVIACRDGWLWQAARGDGRAWLQASFDAGMLRGRGRDAVRRCVRELLQQAETDAGLRIAGGADGVPLLVRNADTVCSAARFDPHVIRIGDAAIAMDPLSGHGLFWALSSALSVAPIVSGLLGSRAGADDLARRFYEARLIRTFWRQARIGRDFYRSEQRFAERPFWRQRAAWPDDKPAHDAAEAPQFARQVVVDDGELREADVVVTRHEPDGVAWVAGLPIAAIARRCLERGLGGDQALELFHHQCAPEASREQAAVCFAWLRARGVLPERRGNLSPGGRGA